MGEVIETKAAWGKTFVEIIDPTKEKHVFRVYFEKPQREWVGLTDEEIDKSWRSVDYTVPWEQHRIDIAQAIEAKLREKNT